MVQLRKDINTHQPLLLATCTVPSCAFWTAFRKFGNLKKYALLLLRRNFVDLVLHPPNRKTILRCGELLRFTDYCWIEISGASSPFFVITTSTLRVFFCGVSSFCLGHGAIFRFREDVVVGEVFGISDAAGWAAGIVRVIY